jgi:protein gp37
MQKTKIEWCTHTWNPVTGCLHNCPYCYAKDIAARFGGFSVAASDEHDLLWTVESAGKLHTLKKAPLIKRTKEGKETKATFPFVFEPTFHKYRLDEPAKQKKPANIFVCSMADLFGAWVPDEWIKEVFAACGRAPQHNYMFLTKNPGRFQSIMVAAGWERIYSNKNFWFGFSVENQEALDRLAMGARWLPGNTFISIEPLQGSINLKRIYPPGHDAMLDFVNGAQYWFGGGDYKGKKIKWVIIGAETGNRRGKVIPKKEWVMDIAEKCGELGVPVFMKDSLVPVVGSGNMRREYPASIEIYARG